MDEREVVVVELDALFELDEAYAAAVAATVAGYGAIAPARVVPRIAVETGGPPAQLAPPARVAWWLRAAAAGSDARLAPAEAVAMARVGRLLTEHLLDDDLHRAVFGVPRRDAVGPGLIDGVRARVTRSALEARLAGSAPRALVTWLPTPVAFYLLARAGLTDAFDVVVGAEVGEGAAPADLDALRAEARARALLRVFAY